MTYGPIDYFAIEFKNDQLTGETLPELLELVKKEIIRVIDLVIIQKEGGDIQVLEMEELSPDVVIFFDPIVAEISGIVQVEDIEVIAEAMEDNTTAVILMIENLWAIKFGEAAVRSGGRLIAFDRIPFEVINETLEIFAQAEA